MRSFRKYTCKHERATRKRQNLRPFLKRDYVSITLRSWNAACFAGCTQCIMGKWRLCVSLSRRIQYGVLPVCACVQVTSTINFSKLWVALEKDTYFSCYRLFLRRKGINHVAGCVFYTFFAILSSNRLVHSSNNWKDSLLSTNILICLFYVIF